MYFWKESFGFFGRFFEAPPSLGSYSAASENEHVGRFGCQKVSNVVVESAFRK